MRRIFPPLLVAIVSSGLLLSACGDKAVEEKPKTIEELVSGVHQQFAQADALKLELTTDKLPSNINGIKSAVGEGDRSPNFEGDIELVTGGAAVGAQVVSIAGDVWALTGLDPQFVLINPADLDAPDPATLIGTGDDGVTAIFDQVTELESKGKSREGNLVLETIQGKVPGKLMASLLPTASAKSPFLVEFRITPKGQFHDLRMTGEFYKGHKTTYRLKISIPEEQPKIEKPI